MKATTKVLEKTIGQHGYWLVNHQELIEEVIESAIYIYGEEIVVDLLNNLNSKLCKDIYRVIESIRIELEWSSDFQKAWNVLTEEEKSDIKTGALNVVV